MLSPGIVLAAEPATTAPTWLWIVTIVLGPVFIAADLFLIEKIHPRLTARAAFAWTVVWFLLGLAFAWPITQAAGETYGIKYSTGYLLEKALTIDQVFVIALILQTWSTPRTVARRLVLIALAILLVVRLPFIWLGYVLAETDSPTLYAIMASLFVLGGIVLLRTRFTHEDPQERRAVKAFGRLRPVLPSYEGTAMTVVRDGKKMYTLSAVVFVALLTADLYFDATVPLAFAFTKPPFIVLASTTFALMGIRSMYVFAASIRMNIVTLKISLALSLWLVAIDLLVSPHLDHPSWIVPVLVMVIVCIPMIVSWRQTDPETRAAQAERVSSGEVADVL